jgi:hypothetical protein
MDEPEPVGWRIAGNGSDTAASPEGRPVEYQWVIGGEGEHDLARFLGLMKSQGWTGALCYEMSAHVQGRPDYDALTAATQTYQWMERAWTSAGVPIG